MKNATHEKKGEKILKLKPLHLIFILYVFIIYTFRTDTLCYVSSRYFSVSVIQTSILAATTQKKRRKFALLNEIIPCLLVSHTHTHTFPLLIYSKDLTNNNSYELLLQTFLLFFFHLLNIPSSRHLFSICCSRYNAIKKTRERTWQSLNRKDCELFNFIQLLKIGCESFQHLVFEFACHNSHTHTHNTQKEVTKNGRNHQF